jgi:hypothetical protein
MTRSSLATLTTAFFMASSFGVGFAQQSSSGSVSVTGGTATGGSATGGAATGGSAVGGSAAGGSVRSGSVVGGSAVGGSATATGGTATGGMATPGTATATVGGRRISASSDSGVSIEARGDDARVQVGTRELLVQRDRILVDGAERARIARSEDLVQIMSTGGRLTVHAGKDRLFSENGGER